MLSKPVASTTITPAAAPLLSGAGWVGLTSIAVTLTANLGVLGVAQLAGADMAVQRSQTEQFTVGPGSVAMMTVAPLLIATILLLPLHRWGPKAWHGLAWTGLLIGVVTVVMPLTSTAAVGSAAALALMHLVVGVVWFITVRHAARHPGV